MSQLLLLLEIIYSSDFTPPGEKPKFFILFSQNQEDLKLTMDERTQQNGGAAASDAVAGRAAAATAGRGGAGGRGGGAGQVHQEFQILLKIEDSGLFEDTGEHGDIVVNLLLLYKSGDVLQHIQ